MKTLIYILLLLFITSCQAVKEKEIISTYKIAITYQNSDRDTITESLTWPGRGKIRVFIDDSSTGLFYKSYSQNACLKIQCTDGWGLSKIVACGVRRFNILSESKINN